MKIVGILFAVVMLSSTLVVGLSIRQPKYTTRQAQEEFLMEHGYYGECAYDNTMDSPVVECGGLDFKNSEEGRFSFEGAIIVGVEDKESRESKHQLTVESTEQMFSKAVRCFQRRFGLQQTGVVNEETRMEMENPSSDVPIRKKRFVTVGKWPKTDLTYYIENYDLDLTKLNTTEQDIRSTIQRAMKFWTDASGLTVTEKNSTDADITFGFYYGAHGDGYPFRGNNIAHAFFPDDGRIHFDGSELWSLNGGDDLLYVATHEFGHALGIHHSDKLYSIMVPKVPLFKQKTALFEDDILAVRSLYGNKTISHNSNTWNWSCDFELANESAADWCGITQASDDQFDWTIFDEPTPSDPTGPDQAFSGRWYIYIETSNPRPPNDTAKIYIPSPNLPGNYCLTFHYHMFGFHIRELQVFRETTGREGQPETIWRKTKEQGNYWLSAALTVAIDSDQTIGFIGVCGDEYSGDIGLDALSLTSNACQ